jgi:anti-sigma regulatory factor (Ser/Thr protein kinase)
MTECSHGGRRVGRAGDPLHCALVYDSDHVLQERATPFLRAGLDREESILALVSPPVERALRSALGEDADRVKWREPGLAHRRLSEVFEECRAFLAGQRAAAAPTRLLTGNDFSSDAAADRLAAYLRYEAASTAVLRPYGYPWICLYDRRRHPALLLDHFGEVHPQLMAADGRPVGSPGYVEAATYLRSHDGALSPVPELVAADLDVTTPAELRTARHRLGSYASSVGCGARAVEAIAIAAHEVLCNALRHGRPPCRLRAWVTGRGLHVRVDDKGHSGAVATAGYGPPATHARAGLGLWVARQLSDVVHTYSSPTHGTAVELQFW